MDKRIMGAALLAVFIAACGGGGSGSAEDTTQVTSPTGAENRSLTDTLGADGSGGAEPAGKAIMANSDCNTCHRDNMKLIGPSYADIAAKYENNEKDVEYLIDKVIAGGGGVWGDVPMAPHANMSRKDAREIVNYILTFKK